MNTPGVSPDDESELESDPTPEPEPEPEWKRRARLAAAFGDVSPSQTSDDTDAREDRAGKGDDWYRDQVPPHHG